MNRNRLLLIGVVALALGALVSLGVYQNLKSKTSKDSRPGSDAVVAAGDIQVGAKLSDSDVRVVHYPDGSMPPDAVNHPLGNEGTDNHNYILRTAQYVVDHY